MPDNPESDKEDDMEDTNQGYQIVNDRRMEKFGWFFERIKIKGFFRCCNEWETEYATLEIQFKTPTGMKDMMKLKQSQQDLQKFQRPIKFNALIYSQDCIKCKAAGMFRP